MGLGRTLAVGLQGVDGFLVRVESDVSAGLPAFTVSGRADRACAQAVDRVRAGAANGGYPLPARRITVNLSPASLPKVGSGFDLAIAVAVLVASGQLPGMLAESVVHLGELGLDGTVRAIRGVLPLTSAAARAGVRDVVVPAGNVAEARLVRGIDVHPVARLADLVERYRAGEDAWRSAPDTALEVDLPENRTPAPDGEAPPPDLADVAGQDEARHALEVAAAGGHHLYLVGPPGAGKTMLAERLPGLLPALDDDEATEVTAIGSLLGTLRDPGALQRRPPFVAPHHGASLAAMVGGGSGAVTPGAITQAHRGVLFLDEAPEFRPAVMQALRQPLESGQVVVARASGRFRFPSRFQLVLAANPCPCGMGYGKGERCLCTPLQRRGYLGKLTGPLLDRVDIQVQVPVPPRRSWTNATAESSEVVAARVAVARAAQLERWSVLGVRLTRDVPGPALRRGSFRLPGAVTVDLDRAVDRGTVTLRGYDRCLRVAWTLADLAGESVPTRDAVGAALALRQQVSRSAA